MVMLMMNCLKVWLINERRFRLVSSRGHWQSFSQFQIPDKLGAGLEPAQNLSSKFYEWIFFLSIFYFTLIVMMYNSSTVQNNILIKIELCSINNHCNTGIHSLCNQFLFSYIVYQGINIQKAINMQIEVTSCTYLLSSERWHKVWQFVRLVL